MIYCASSISNSQIKMVMNLENDRGASENPLGTKIKTATMSTETNCTSTHDKDMCSPGSVTDNSESERVQSNSLKFGIANILRESEQSSVTVQNSHKCQTSREELSTISRNTLLHTNNARLLLNPYFVPTSPIIWPLKDFSRDRQIRK
jgi:hypothetical protein